MMSKLAVVPGTFDPITNGHLDIVERSLRIFDEVVVAVATNPKKKPLFSLEDRIRLAHRTLARKKRVSVESFEGLLVRYARSRGGIALVRGLRAISDFEYELQMALMNRRIDSEVETVFLMPNEDYSFLTSTIVKEIASLGGPISSLVHPVVEKALVKHFGQGTATQRKR